MDRSYDGACPFFFLSREPDIFSKNKYLFLICYLIVQNGDSRKEIIALGQKVRINLLSVDNERESGKLNNVKIVYISYLKDNL